MSDPAPPPGPPGPSGVPPGAPYTGLCAACRHHRWITNRRGSSFLLCEKSAEDARFPRYPRLPVLGCAGYESTAADASG